MLSELTQTLSDLLSNQTCPALPNASSTIANASNTLAQNVTALMQPLASTSADHHACPPCQFGLEPLSALFGVVAGITMWEYLRRANAPAVQNRTTIAIVGPNGEEQGELEVVLNRTGLRFRT